MASALYTKYGAPTIDPSAMQAGLTAQKTNLKDILGNVKTLMENQEAGAIQENTLNMQNYLKEKIKADGLGTALTEPVDKIGIKQKFGNMIDMSALDSTINEQTKQMKDAALTDATKQYLNTFDQTKDESASVNIYQKRLAELGMPASMIGEATTKVMTDNAALPKMQEVAKAKMLETKTADFTSLLRDPLSANISFKDAINFVGADVANKDKPAMITHLKSVYDSLTKMDDNQKTDFESAKALINNGVKADELRIMAPVEAAKLEYENTSNPISENITELAKNISGKNLKGIAEQIGTENSNGILKGAARLFGEIFSWDQMTGGEVAENVERNVSSIMKTYSLDRDEAVAIALQAAQEQKALVSAGKIGNVLSESGLKQSMENIAGQIQTRNVANQKYVVAQKIAAEKLKTIQDKGIKSTDELLRTIRSGNIQLNYDNVMSIYNKNPYKSDFPSAASANKDAKETVTPEQSREAKALAAAGLDPTGKPLPNGPKAAENTTLPQPPPAPMPGGKPSDKGKAAAVATANLQQSARQQQQSDYDNQGLIGKATKWFKSDDKVKSLDSISGIPSAGASIPTDKVQAATDLKRGIVAGYDIKSYASDKNHEQKVLNIHSSIPDVSTATDVQNYIASNYPTSPIKGSMIMASASKHGVSPKMLMSIIAADSSFGTKGLGKKTNNPGNVGNDDAGNKVYYKSLQAGIDAAANNLSKRKVKRK